MALHLLVLFIRLASPPGAVRPSDRFYSRLDATLAKPPSPATAPPQPEPASPRRPAQRSRETLALTEPARTWTQAEKNEMEDFLGELGREARPPKGSELAQRALAMARRMPVLEEDNEIKEMMQKLSDANVDRYSLEMYFEALFRRMNRSAALVERTDFNRGRHVAAVRIVVDHDGTVKSFKILWAADQQDEIAYIKSVVDRASPFPVFPADIRKATDTIVLQVCILPGHALEGGAAFSRMSPGQGCRDPNS